MGQGQEQHKEENNPSERGQGQEHHREQNSSSEKVHRKSWNRTWLAASLLGSAMVARGEIGLLIIEIGHNETPYVTEEGFITGVWAILLNTIIGPSPLGWWSGFSESSLAKASGVCRSCKCRVLLVGKKMCVEKYNTDCSKWQAAAQERLGEAKRQSYLVEPITVSDVGS